MGKECNSVVRDQAVLRDLYSHYGGFWRYPQMLDFCYLVNPYFTRTGIVKEMQDFFPTLLSQYPSGLRINSQLAGECWGIKPEYVVPGNGAAELIKILMDIIKGKMGVIRPTFEEYPNRLKDEQVVSFIPNDKEFRYNADDIISFYNNHDIKVLLLINPDNPSGNFISINGVKKLAQWAKAKGIRFILDESFVDFSIGYEDNTCLYNEMLEEFPNMCVMKSISKSYGVPGLRLGILCSSDTKLIETMKQKVSIWNINSFAEFFMQIFPKYKKEYREACGQFIKAREDFAKALQEIPYIHVMPSQANYFFLEVLPPYTPIELCAILLKKYNILASACLAKKGIEPNRYMRIAVRNHSDNNAFVKALKDLIK